MYIWVNIYSNIFITKIFFGKHLMVKSNLLSTHFLNRIFQLLKGTSFVSLLFQAKDNVNTPEHFIEYFEMVRERKIPCATRCLGFLGFKKMTKSFVCWQLGTTKNNQEKRIKHYFVILLIIYIYIICYITNYYFEGW
jgi:hypothetical protein